MEIKGEQYVKCKNNRKHRSSGGGKIGGHEAATIVDSGANFIRINDGTQICWGDVSPSLSGVNNITFEQPFLDTTYGIAKSIVSTSSSGTITPRLLSVYGKETSYFQAYSTTHITWVAIGRWK